MDGSSFPGNRFRSAASLLLGGTAGIFLAVLVGAAPASRSTTAGSEPRLEATHLPPLLRSDTDAPELRFDAYCLGTDADEADEPCDVTGTVFVRAGEHGAFREFEVEVDAHAQAGRLVARVPPSFTRAAGGFSYYAVLRDVATGAVATLPAGGEAAPQHSRLLVRETEVDLGAHAFGRTRPAGSRVAFARWGSGTGEVGLEGGPNQPPIGAASFDVGADGAVHVLDEANRRLLRWSRSATAPTSMPLGINGTLADLAVATDGTIHVLETTSADGDAGGPVLRSFRPDGVPSGLQRIAERSSQLRLGPGDTPIALQHPSGQWMAVASRDGTTLAPARQRASGRAGRPLPAGGEVVVLRHANEIRVAVLEDVRLRGSWRVTSATPLAEVQLAEPVGERVVLVVRAYTDDRDEFAVLVLGPEGLVERFSVPSADWAEAAPLSRFRLVGRALYQLGSGPEGVFVDRFDLEVR